MSHTFKPRMDALPPAQQRLWPELRKAPDLDDLMATKVKVVLPRAEAKDYRDVAAMLNAGVSLSRGLFCCDNAGLFNLGFFCQALLECCHTLLVKLLRDLGFQLCKRWQLCGPNVVNTNDVVAKLGLGRNFGCLALVQL